MDETTDLVYDLYQVNICNKWVTIDPNLPLFPQTRGMRAYRCVTRNFTRVELSKESDFRYPTFPMQF